MDLQPLIINYNSKFSLIHTNISKGLAASFMVYYHLHFVIKKNCIHEFGLNFSKIFGIYSKICTGIYVFLTGLGFYYSLIKLSSLKEMYKKIFKNFFKLLLNFYVILFLFFPLGLKAKLFSFDKDILKQIFFFSYSRFNYWWYIRQYLVILCYAPLIIRFYQNISLKKKVIPFFYFYIIYMILKYIDTNFKSKSINYEIFHTYFNQIFTYKIIFLFLSGNFCARYNIMSNYENGDKIDKLFFYSFSIFTSIYFRKIIVTFDNDIILDFLCVPLLIFPISYLFAEIKTLKFIFCFLGKHSTNIWLLHGYWLQEIIISKKFLYFPKYTFLIWFWFILLTIFTSYIVNIIFIPINNLIFKKVLNYEGYFYINYNNKKKKEKD